MNLKKIFYLLTIFILFSCNNATETKQVTEIILDTSSVVPENASVIPIENIIEEKDENDFKILLPARYRDWEKKNATDDLTGNWLEIYEKNGKYFLAKADYRIQKGFDDCSSDSTKSIESKNKVLILLENVQLRSGAVETVKLLKNKIWPTEKMSFHFNGIDYLVRAQGKILSAEKVSTENGTEIFQNVKDYQLFISANGGPESLFLEQESFNDTFVEILFIGDIDRDGKPDFIFGANRDYEEERVILYLSSEAKDGKIIKKVSEIAVQFDC